MTKVEQVKEILGIPKHIRLGQEIWNRMNMYDDNWVSPEANTLFFISDDDLDQLLK
jgi:hypothetical protein